MKSVDKRTFVNVRDTNAVFTNDKGQSHKFGLFGSGWVWGGGLLTPSLYPAIAFSELCEFFFVIEVDVKECTR